jgi:hypothetical protein
MWSTSPPGFNTQWVLGLGEGGAALSPTAGRAWAKEVWGRGPHVYGHCHCEWQNAGSASTTCEFYRGGGWQEGNYVLGGGAVLLPTLGRAWTIWLESDLTRARRCTQHMKVVIYARGTVGRVPASNKCLGGGCLR